MNLLFLVEGEKTEPKVYKAWLQHIFPSLTFVIRPEDMTTNTCRIVAGNGYPNMVSKPKQYSGVSRLEALLLDIKNYCNVNHFFICVDSEDESYVSRYHEVKTKLESFIASHNVDTSKTEIHIIIQHCCIETWALGNAKIPHQYTATKSSTLLAEFQAYYNVLVDDPEQMLCCPPSHAFRTKAKFHKKYLEEYLKEFGLSYSKKNPKFIEERSYLDGLKERCESTTHLSSLKLLLDTWDRIDIS